MQKFGNWIGGEWVEAISGKTYRALNPATEEEIAEVPLGGRLDVDRAVQAARRAFPIWSKVPQAERSRLIEKMATLQQEYAEELIRWDILDHGTPVRLARMQAVLSAENLEFSARASRALMGGSIASGASTMRHVLREPIGVAALIIPWNAPLLMLTTKMGACLATGNTCVIKPSAIDSLVILKYMEIVEKLGLPPGTVNVVTGPGGVVGEALATHPEVDFISFTGSTETGKAIMAGGSATLKRMQMELGGKNPFIVLEDADIGTVARRAAESTCLNSGMVCGSPGRFYIHERVHDEFVDQYVAALQEVAVGDPQDEQTDMGPVVSAEHRDRVEGYIRSAVAEGAKLVLGGERPMHPPLNKGYYVLPTVFTEVKPHMKIFREEIFGPVGCVARFTADEEVIDSANDNIYGLCASVWTGDTARGMRLACRINAGAVGVNIARHGAPELPWGGFKQSGFGKENSVYGLEEYTQLKLLSVDYA